MFAVNERCVVECQLRCLFFIHVLKFFFEILEVLNNEYGGCFHQQISVMEFGYRENFKPNMITVGFCRTKFHYHTKEK